jgi:hypothetical protein
MSPAQRPQRGRHMSSTLENEATRGSYPSQARRLKDAVCLSVLCFVAAGVAATAFRHHAPVLGGCT